MRRKITKPWGGKSLPEDVEGTGSPDSSPTPVIEMGWRALHSRFELVASRLESHAFVLRKHPIKMDLDKSKKCDELAKEVRRMANRVLDWPKKSAGAIAGEKSIIAEKYIEIICEAQKIMDGKVV